MNKCLNEYKKIGDVFENIIERFGKEYLSNITNNISFNFSSNIDSKYSYILIKSNDIIIDSTNNMIKGILCNENNIFNDYQNKDLAMIEYNLGNFKNFFCLDFKIINVLHNKGELNCIDEFKNNKDFTLNEAIDEIRKLYYKDDTTEFNKFNDILLKYYKTDISFTENKYIRFKFKNYKMKRNIYDMQKSFQNILRLIASTIQKNDLDLLIIDEPEEGLDIKNQLDIWDIFENVKGKIVIATHSKHICKKYIGNINYISDHKLCKIIVPDVKSNKASMKEIHIDNIMTILTERDKKIIICEGETDKIYLKFVINKILPKHKKHILILAFHGKENLKELCVQEHIQNNENLFIIYDIDEQNFIDKYKYKILGMNKNLEEFIIKTSEDDFMWNDYEKNKKAFKTKINNCLNDMAKNYSIKSDANTTNNFYNMIRKSVKNVSDKKENILNSNIKKFISNK